MYQTRNIIDRQERANASRKFPFPFVIKELVISGTFVAHMSARTEARNRGTSETEAATHWHAFAEDQFQDDPASQGGIRTGAVSVGHAAGTGPHRQARLQGSSTRLAEVVQEHGPQADEKRPVVPGLCGTPRLNGAARRQQWTHRPNRRIRTRNGVKQQSALQAKRSGSRRDRYQGGKVTAAAKTGPPASATQRRRQQFWESARPRH